MQWSVILATALGLGCTTACITEPETETLPMDGEHVLTLESQKGLTEAHVALADATLARGSNSFVVELVPHRAKAAAELIAVSALMPAHGHGAPEPRITISDGRYRVENLILNMPGLWDIRFDLNVSGNADSLEFALNLP